MATTFAEAKAALDDISTVITQRRKSIANLLNEATQSESALTALQADYIGIIADINANLTANPSDPAYVNQKAEKDLLVSEFMSLKTKATSVKNAINTALNS